MIKSESSIEIFHTSGEMKWRATRYWSFVIFITILIPSCQRKEAVTEEKASVSFNQVRDAFFNNLSTAPDLASKLQKASGNFHKDLLNDPKNYLLYSNDPVKAAANLGVYLADLNYCVAYRQTTTTKDLFHAANELSKVIGIEKEVLNYLMNRYAANLQQNDSAKSIIHDLFQKSTSGLKDTNRERFAGIAMAAYEIEDLHLALGTIDSPLTDTSQDILEKVFSIILNQQKNIETIYNFIEANSDPLDPDKNPNYLFYTNAFQELISIYKELTGNQEREVNDTTVGKLREKVNTIRTKIVSL